MREKNPLTKYQQDIPISFHIALHKSYRLDILGTWWYKCRDHFGGDLGTYLPRMPSNYHDMLKATEDPEVFVLPVQPWKLTAGTWKNHPNLNRKIIWTKPLYLGVLLGGTVEPNKSSMQLRSRSDPPPWLPMTTNNKNTQRIHGTITYIYPTKIKAFM